MKTRILITLVAALVIGSCSSSKVASYQSYEDDVYFNPKAANATVAPRYAGSAYATSSVAADSYTAVSPTDNNTGMSNYERYILALESGQSVEEATAYVKSAPVEYYDAPAGNGQMQYAYVETSQTQDKQGNTYITNNYYDDSYAARINRFSGPYLGFSYFDPWYYGPSYRFGYSSYYGWNMSFGWGYPYYSSWYSPYRYGYYDPWYRPYYGYYDPWYYRPYYSNCWSCTPYHHHVYYTNRTRVVGPVQRRSGGLTYASTSTSSANRTSASSLSSSRRTATTSSAVRSSSSASTAARSSSTPASYTRSATTSSSQQRTSTAASTTPTRTSQSAANNSTPTRTSQGTANPATNTRVSNSSTTPSSATYSTPRTNNTTTVTQQRSSSANNSATTNNSSSRSSSSYTAPSNS